VALKKEVSKLKQQQKEVSSLSCDATREAKRQRVSRQISKVKTILNEENECLDEFDFSYRGGGKSGGNSNDD
jgi:hypothetical protein